MDFDADGGADKHMREKNHLIGRLSKTAKTFRLIIWVYYTLLERRWEI